MTDGALEDDSLGEREVLLDVGDLEDGVPAAARAGLRVLGDGGTHAFRTSSQ